MAKDYCYPPVAISGHLLELLQVLLNRTRGTFDGVGRQISSDGFTVDFDGLSLQDRQQKLAVRVGSRLSVIVCERVELG